ncbi:hypothetical protein KEM56_007047 [Ascosphaera pollenicola]|nr:hypothetical protein KEM56_007047 [Ascosphaera pollenicola]
MPEVKLFNRERRVFTGSWPNPYIDQVGSAVEHVIEELNHAVGDLQRTSEDIVTQAEINMDGTGHEITSKNGRWLGALSILQNAARVPRSSLGNLHIQRPTYAPQQPVSPVLQIHSIK